MSGKKPQGEVLVGVLIVGALILGALAGAVYVVSHYGETLAKGAGVLLVLGVFVWLASLPAAPISREEQERQRRSFVNYQISQDIAERREAHREQMAQWRQAQQPPPRDVSSQGGGGRYC